LKNILRETKLFRQGFRRDTSHKMNYDICIAAGAHNNLGGIERYNVGLVEHDRESGVLPGGIGSTMGTMPESDVLRDEWRKYCYLGEGI
jgi:hypothetical protein